MLHYKMYDMVWFQSEDKLKPPSNINGTLIVLEHVVQQPYFPKLARDILQLFLSR